MGGQSERVYTETRPELRIRTRRRGRWHRYRDRKTVTTERESALGAGGQGEGLGAGRAAGGTYLSRGLASYSRAHAKLQGGGGEGQGWRRLSQPDALLAESPVTLSAFAGLSDLWGPQQTLLPAPACSGVGAQDWPPGGGGERHLGQACSPPGQEIPLQSPRPKSASFPLVPAEIVTTCYSG